MMGSVEQDVDGFPVALKCVDKIGITQVRLDARPADTQFEPGDHPFVT